MCGIVGIVSAYSSGLGYDEGKAFTDMLFVDTLRGFDSTGVFGVSNKGNVGILKAALSGPDFIQTTEYTSFMTDAVSRGKMLVGHNRSATRGSVSDKNAHPFWVDDKIVLVQNGTWNGDHSHVKNTEVDSEAIAHLLSDNEDIETALQQVDAAYALVWYNVETKTLHGIRNTQRPLAIAYTTAGSIMFASEISTILFAASRQSIKLQKAPYIIAEHNLMSFTLDADKGEYDEEYKKINSEFDYSKYGKHTAATYDVASWRSHYQHLGDSWETDLDDSRGLLPGNDQRLSENVAKDVRISLNDLVRQGKFAGWALDKDKASDLAADLRIRPFDKRIAVEFIDYLPANHHRNCRSFYLYGKVLSTDEVDTSPLVYQLLMDTDELVLMDAVQKSLFTVTLSTSIEHELLNGQKVVTIFATDRKPILTLENNGQTQ
jgi:hypothetical protein